MLDRILLRRTKEGRSEDIIVPPKHIVLRKDPFDAFEADYYQSVYTQSQTQFNAYVASGTVRNTPALLTGVCARPSESARLCSGICMHEGGDARKRR